MSMITIIGGNKGGSGKTTTAVNLAVGLARTGAEVCIVDADVQRSASRWFAERENSGATPLMTLVEKRDNIATAIKSLGTRFDHVIVDVAGRNSRELVTGASVADCVIAPHQCSQLDLDTLMDLRVQLQRVRDTNPDLHIYIYHSMASTNPAVREAERREFLTFTQEFADFKPLESVGFYRKAYRDMIPEGRSVLEGTNENAKQEILSLLQEVYGCH